MFDAVMLAEARARSLAAGAGPGDLAWADELRWSDAAVPPVGSEAQAEDYRRRERAFNAAVAHLSFAERGESPEGKLAAAIGAAIANWGDRDEDEAN